MQHAHLIFDFIMFTLVAFAAYRWGRRDERKVRIHLHRLDQHGTVEYAGAPPSCVSETFELRARIAELEKHRYVAVNRPDGTHLVRAGVYEDAEKRVEQLENDIKFLAKALEQAGGRVAYGEDGHVDGVNWNNQSLVPCPGLPLATASALVDAQGGAYGAACSSVGAGAIGGAYSAVGGLVGDALAPVVAPILARKAAAEAA